MASSSSSQSTPSIPFSSAHAQQAFKLIELPAELLVLLESDNPPILSITSSSSSSTATTTTGYATLCFGDKKYQMRQKNTSNPILILQPSSSISSRKIKPPPTETIDEDEEEEKEEGDSIPTPALTAIAKCEDTIELVLQLPEEETKVERKINKWHEKFAKGRRVEK